MSQDDEGHKGDAACKTDEVSRDGEEWTVRGLTSQDDVERSDSIYAWPPKTDAATETGMMIRRTLPGMKILSHQPLHPPTKPRGEC